MVDAKGAPIDMVVFPKSPEEMITLDVKFSASENVSV